jgi:hypothetical protein
MLRIAQHFEQDNKRGVHSDLGFVGMNRNSKKENSCKTLNKYIFKFTITWYVSMLYDGPSETMASIEVYPTQCHSLNIIAPSRAMVRRIVLPDLLRERWPFYDSFNSISLRSSGACIQKHAPFSIDETINGNCDWNSKRVPDVRING